MKKLLAVILSVCMTLAVCSSCFAEGEKETDKTDDSFKELGDKLSQYIDSESLSAILSTINRLAKLNEESSAFDYEGTYDPVEYLYRLGYGDVLESGKYTEGVTDYLRNLLADTEKYAEGTLTKEGLLDLISRGSGKTDNLFKMDEDIILNFNDNELFTLEDIKYILKELGFEEELTDEEHENLFFALLFIMRMIEIYYRDSLGTIDPLEVMYMLQAISSLYGIEELDEIDVHKIIELLGIEDAANILTAAKVASMAYKAVEDEPEDEPAEKSAENQKPQSNEKLPLIVSPTPHPSYPNLRGI